MSLLTDCDDTHLCQQCAVRMSCMRERFRQAREMSRTQKAQERRKLKTLMMELRHGHHQQPD